MTGNLSERVEIGSPQWLAQLLNRLCDRVAAIFLAASRNKYFLCASAFLTGVVFLLPSLHWFLASRATFGATFGMFSNFILTMPAISLLLFVTGGLPGRLVLALRQAPIVASITFLFAVGLNRLWYGVFNFVPLAVEFLFLAGGVWLLMGLSRSWRWAVRLTLFAFLLVAAYFYPSLPIAENATIFRGTGFVFEIMMFLAPFLVAQGLLGSEGIGTRAALSYVFSPAQFIYRTLPIPPSEGSADACDGSRATGLLNLLGGFSLVIGCSVASRNFLPAGGTDSVPAFLARGWLNYLLYYVGFLGSLHVGVGLARWLGFRLEAPADQALLATNLVDRWKRWNFFFYWFYLTFVWLPVARRTSSLFLATLLVFLVNFFWHNVMAMNRLLFLPSGPSVATDLCRQLVFFAGQAVMLTAAFHYQSKLPGENRRRGWGGVAFCHLQMAVLYGIL